MKSNLEKKILLTYELVKDINQKLDYLIERKREGFYRHNNYRESG